MEEQKIGVGLEFCGVRYRAVESGEYLDQDVYVHNKLEHLNTGKLRGRNPDDELDSDFSAVYGNNNRTAHLGLTHSAAPLALLYT